MIQIFKSDLVDLLRDHETLPCDLSIEEDANDLIYVKGATVISPDDFTSEDGVDQLIRIFNRGVDNRIMRSTDINETSSRSHLLFSIRVEKYKKDTGKLDRIGKLTFIDLAGSERTAKIGFDEELYEEGLFINESLQCLGRVITRLASGKGCTEYHFKWNPLTHLLMDSLGGLSQTLMMVNISPSKFDIEATKETLKFAELTGRIKPM
jgi:hypothetical protein